jgi:hypothetical protein
MLLLQRTELPPPAAAGAPAPTALVRLGVCLPLPLGGCRLLLAGTTRGCVALTMRPNARATGGFWLLSSPAALAADRVSTPAVCCSVADSCGAAPVWGVVLSRPRPTERRVVYLGVVLAFSLPPADALGVLGLGFAF